MITFIMYVASNGSVGNMSCVAHTHTLTHGPARPPAARARVHPRSRCRQLLARGRGAGAAQATRGRRAHGGDGGRTPPDQGPRRKRCRTVSQPSIASFRLASTEPSLPRAAAAATSCSPECPAITP